MNTASNSLIQNKTANNKVIRAKAKRANHAKKRKQQKKSEKQNKGCNECGKHSDRYWGTSKCNWKICIICAFIKFTMGIDIKCGGDCNCKCNGKCKCGGDCKCKCECKCGGVCNNMYPPQMIEKFLRDHSYSMVRALYIRPTKLPTSFTKKAIKKRQQRQNKRKSTTTTCDICMYNIGEQSKTSSSPDDYKCSEFVCLSGCRHKICKCCMITQLTHRVPRKERNGMYPDHNKIMENKFKCCFCKADIPIKDGLKFIRDDMLMKYKKEVYNNIAKTLIDTIINNYIKR